jgi:hypothetical protein
MRTLIVIAAAFMSLSAFGQESDPDTTPVWVKQKANTKAYRFSVLTARGGWESVAPRALRIHDRRTGSLVQEFLDIDSMQPHAREDELVHVVDANFDGHPDIMLAMDSGGAGPNNTSSCYLYDPTKRRFVLDEALSALTQVRINRDRTITSFGRGGCCIHSEERYRYIGNRLTMVFSEVRKSDNENTAITTGRLTNGKMKYVTRTVKQ